ncbi:MAG: phosphoribosyl-ATP diphosphatase [Alphaproteobacteria bacterium]
MSDTDPKAVLDRLHATILNRRGGDTRTSHTARMFAGGTKKIAQKFGEEAVEAVIAATAGDRDGTIKESADVMYHLLLLWTDLGIRPDEVWSELAAREGISGITEKESRPDN